MTTNYDIERRHEAGRDADTGHIVLEACTEVTCPVKHVWSIFSREDHGNIHGFAVWLSDHDTAQLANIALTAYRENMADSVYVARPHYIAMNGTSGCLPDSCDVYLSEESAIEALRDRLELTTDQVNGLSDTHQTACTPEQGAQYASVQICTCHSPWEHQEHMTEAGFIRDCPEFFEEEEQDA